jgi:hypothetical protein
MLKILDLTALNALADEVKVLGSRLKISSNIRRN